MKTKEEIKDEVAGSKGYVDFYNLESKCVLGLESKTFLIQVMDEAMELYAEQFKEGEYNNNAWPLQDVFKKLVFAAEILLNQKNYDGEMHEEILHCINRAKELITLPPFKA